MTSPNTVLFRIDLPRTNTIYRGKIIGCTENRVTPRGQFTITDILIQNRDGFRNLSVPLPVGLQLYQCLHTDHRASRMNDITFKFQVIEEIQRITGFKMYDASEWVGDKLKRERQVK